MKISKKSIASAVAVSSLLFNAFATSAYAANTVTISGNGSDSSNTAAVESNKANTVVQNNTADFSNFIHTTSNTGGNVASDNTGGDVVIATGNSTSEVDVLNRANQNHAVVADCDCPGGNLDVKISGNGSDSDNAAVVATNTSNDLFQNNVADFNNKVSVYGNTGKNYANDNTGATLGGSDVMILTGNAVSDVTVVNEANKNMAHIGGSSAGLSGGTSVEISGNGSDSYNTVALAKNRANTLVQENDAYFSNWVDQDLNTGKNFANDNTGGSVLVDTGAAYAGTTIANSANFNFAHLDCGCVTGGFAAKVAGNGSESDSLITSSANEANGAFQDNNGDFWNKVYGDADSGYNKASDNTGSVLSDPAIFTGNSGSETAVANQANVNVYGSSIGLPGGLELSLGWDWASLVAMVH